MDLIVIRNLRAETYLGIHEWEQRGPRPVLLDLELASDAARAARSDHIDDALDYAAVSARLVEDLRCQRHALIETLAEHCAQLLREEFRVPWLRLWLRKPGALGEDIEVGLRIERGTRPPTEAAHRDSFEAQSPAADGAVRRDQE